MNLCPICMVAATTLTPTSAVFPCGNELKLVTLADGRQRWEATNPLSTTDASGTRSGLHPCKKTIARMSDQHRVQNGMPARTMPLDMYGYCMACTFAKHHPHHKSKSRKAEDLPQINKTAIACVCACNCGYIHHA